jgi:hypothetical protein
MSSAQLDLQSLDETTAETEAATPLGLKAQAAQRLAAHRARRTLRSGNSSTHIVQPAPAEVRSSRIATAVAERYAQSQSYRSFLAAEAERAIREAQAAAEVAAITAQAVADAQYQLLDELDQLSLTPAQPELVPAPVQTLASASAAPLPAPTSPHTPNSGKLTVRLYEDATLPHAEPTTSTHRHQTWELADEAEGLALDEEIAFRQSPVFEEPLGPPTEIPANLIEFPRQLVAPRKARPRLAEGPLREDPDQLSQRPETAQLRIFEVETTEISTTPVVDSIESVAPEWSSILLSALPASIPVESAQPYYDPFQPLHVAPVSLRVMAGIVDACILLASFLAFTATFAITVGKLASTQIESNVAGQLVAPMTIQSAAVGAAVVLGVLALVYHLLFFTLGEATPGMRYARIGLCTFSDENPTRSAMRRRLFAMILSACPLGIGFFWACLDDDRLGWHDRISRMYQRSY